MSEVEKKTWSIGSAAGRSASTAASMSTWTQRASAAIVTSRHCSAIVRTAARSPGDATGKPASMMSTPRSDSAAATSNFSSRFIVAPGDCSPSRRVVSKMRTRCTPVSVMPASLLRGRWLPSPPPRLRASPPLPILGEGVGG